MGRIVYISEPIEFWNAYYQKGYGMQVYQGVPLQRGNGIGNWFRGLFRMAWPLLRTAGTAAAAEGLSSAAQVARDVSQGEEWKKAARKRAFEGSSKLLDQASDHLKKQQGKGVGVRGKKVSKTIKRTRKHKKDIFAH